MTIIIVENVNEAIKGEISKWLIEIKSGIFIGNLTALVRDELWFHLINKIPKEGSIIEIWATNTEQSFDLREYNVKKYIPVDFEGIWLFKKPTI